MELEINMGPEIYGIYIQLSEPGSAYDLLTYGSSVPRVWLIPPISRLALTTVLPWSFYIPIVERYGDECYMFNCWHGILKFIYFIFIIRRTKLVTIFQGLPILGHVIQIFRLCDHQLDISSSTVRLNDMIKIGR